MTTTKKGDCGCGGSSTAMVTRASGAMVKAAGGCGCGGGGGAKSCGCGAKAGCSACQGETFVRPLFFGGQLLTEDDLQALVDYVVGKNRLHNRMLFGAGVVCGLEVSCDPCDCGKVIVRPGYALDCCGNDILVPCPITLDINQMVRQLRAKLSGSDCGDPCKEATSPGATGAESDQPTGRSNLERRYCLYIKYCEQPAEPVAPYATDDCSPSGCQASRTQEGFVFELRCEEVAVERPTIGDRLQGCEKQDDTVAEEERLVSTLYAPLPRALALALKERTFQLAADAQKRRAAARERFDDRLKGLGEVAKLPDLVAAAEDLLALGRVDAEFVVASEQPRPERVAADPLQTLAARLARKLPENLPDTFQSRFVREIAAYFEQPLTALAKDDPIAVRALAHGAAVIPALIVASAGPVQRVYDSLARMAEKPSVTACNTQQGIENFRLPRTGVQDGVIDYDQLLRAARSVRWLLTSTAKLQAECICSAVNPPCNACDDDAVLLACLTVADCCVGNICNLERDFVLTGPNVRYWVPAIDEVFEGIEACCCPEGCDDDARLIAQRECLDGMRRALGGPKLLEYVRGAQGIGIAAPAAAEAAPAAATRSELLAVQRELAELRALHGELKAGYDALKQSMHKPAAKR